MIELSFDDAQPIRGYPVETATRAVLRPLLSEEEYLNGDIVSMQQTLHAMWCARLAELRDFGWRVVRDPERFHYACNCTPFGLYLTTRSKFCTFVFCPNCWGRTRDIQGYDKFVRACFNGDDRYARKGLYLAEFKWEERLPRVKGIIKSVLPRLKDEHSRWHRCWEVEHIPNVGGMVLHNFIPMPDCTMYVRRGLLLIRSKKPQVNEGGEEIIQPKGFSLWNVDLKYRYHVRDAVARVCRYPVRLMRCPVEDLGAFIWSVEGAKLMSFYGRLRDRHS